MRTATVVAAIAASLVSVAASGEQPSVTPSTVFLITDLKDVVSATGTWAIPDARTPGEHIADPINAVRIWCQKSTHQCIEAVGIVQYGNALVVDLIPYDVTGWTKQEITAETGALCSTSVLTINLVAKEVFRITRNGGTSPTGCKEMSTWKPFKKPVIEKLVDGLDAMKDVSRTH